MNIPIIIESNKFLNRISLFMKVGGITLYPMIIIREGRRTSKLINHESIHIVQQKELLLIFFYIIYIAELLIGAVKYGSFKESYMNISFEKEAYANELNLNYLKSRKPYSFLKYF